jgi:hypothetical protein
MGLDPQNLASHGDPDLGWRIGGKRNPPPIDRLIMKSFQALSRTHIPFSDAPATPLCWLSSDRKRWGLTKAGVREAKILAGIWNATSDFLEERLGAPGGMHNSDTYKVIRAALSRKFKISVSAQTIDDHIQQFFQRLIHRDALAGWLASGGTISNARLAGFAIRSASTDWRDSARNPVFRIFLGAKTETELQMAAAGVQQKHRVPPSDVKVVWNKDKSKDTDVSTFDVMDASPSIEETLMFLDSWQEVCTFLQKRKPESWERYTQALNLRLEGHSLKEIQAEMGVRGNRAAAILAEARSVLKKARDQGRFQSFDVTS